MLDLSDATTNYCLAITSDAASSILIRFIIVMKPSAALPVIFTKINAVCTNNKVQVSWNTGSESGVKNYEVERSIDGVYFSKMLHVAALNTATGASYQWLDAQPFKGNNFYRIRSNDQNGRFIYSSIATVDLNPKKGIQVNPSVISNQQFTLYSNQQPAGNYLVSLTYSSGKQLYQKMIINTGRNNAQVIELGNASMPSGVYNLLVNDGKGNKQNFRLLIN